MIALVQFGTRPTSAVTVGNGFATAVQTCVSALVTATHVSKRRDGTCVKGAVHNFVTTVLISRRAFVQCATLLPVICAPIITICAQIVVNVSAVTIQRSWQSVTAVVLICVINVNCSHVRIARLNYATNAQQICFDFVKDVAQGKSVTDVMCVPSVKM